MAEQARTILVVGGGIAGTSVGLHVSDAGHRALVIDEAPVIGGALLLLDKTYPTDSCGVCFLSPDPPAVCPFLECERDPRVELRPLTELVSLEGEPGSFMATLVTHPRFVNSELCDGCGVCAEDVCPVVVRAGHIGGAWLNEEHKAIYRPFPQSVPASYVIDSSACTRCGECVKACPRGAIDLEQQETTEKVEVAAVVLTPGFGPNDAHLRGAYGYGEYLNVISSLEYERMLSTSSPTKGRPVRPSDGQPARRVAIIHCVGSRDRSCGMPYCSAACCMIAAKQASLTKRRDPDAQVVVFTMDVRAPGRSYERYLARVKAQEGVSYRRSLVSGVKLDPQTQELNLQFAQDGRSLSEAFDLVVLDVGMVVPPSVRDMASNCGIDLNAYGFATTASHAPTKTSRPGVFVAGSFREPKDIPATVAESIAAAAQALELAGPLPIVEAESEETKIVTPSFYDPPVIGVFLDGDSLELATGLDIAWLASEVAQLEDVAYVGQSIEDKEICAAITKYGLKHVIIGDRSARRDGQERATFGGVPVTYLALGTTDAFVHLAWPGLITPKAFDMIRMVVERARAAVPRTVAIKMPENKALVLGGSLAGLVAARTLSSQGVETYLVEQADALGEGLQAGEPSQHPWLGDLIAKIKADPRISVHTSSELKSLGGEPGRMASTISTSEGEVEIVHGALVLAIEANEHRPEGYGLEQDWVITQTELGERIAQLTREGANDRVPSSVVMIQCAGTREGARLYCSRNCCIEALNNAISLKELAPETRIAILFRDMVTPGFSEDLYQQAREKGVFFLRYTLGNRPEIDGKSLKVVDDVLGEELALQPDLLVLSTGIVPSDRYPLLAEALGLELDEDGFFLPLNIKSQPMDLKRPGMYLAGLAGGPATLEETIEQGMGAALRAALFLRRGIKTPLTIARVDERICSGCGLCVEVCPTGARQVDEDLGIAEVDPWLCLGCGVCTAVCPNGASSQAMHEARGVLSALDVALG